MPSTFDAIPLPRRGESFLLRTTHNGNSTAVLVDVGWKVGGSEMPDALDAYLRNYMPELVMIDRLILTHEDADHCEGAPQFIANWLRSGRAISQVWLPSI